MTARIEPVTGRYAHLALDGRPHRIYFEEAGQGIPLLCLHTAGSDARQYRAVLNDPAITRHYRVVAFDMPWHGKSSPPAGWEKEDYRLSTSSYTGLIMTVARELGLARPVVMGCSIGGRIVLNLALEHARELRALVGLQSAAYVERYYESAWLNHAEVHGGQASGAIAYGLMSPLSPDEHRWETVWHYMQGGPGIFTGDLYFYQVDGDLRDRIGAIDTERLPALHAHRRVRLLGVAQGHRGGGRADPRREGHDHEGPRPLPDEREPGRLPRVSAPGARRDPRDDRVTRRGAASAKLRIRATCRPSSRRIAGNALEGCSSS